MDETFDVSTNCYLPANGRIHLTTTKEGSWYAPTVTIESGALYVTDVDAAPTQCLNEGQQPALAYVVIEVAKLTGQLKDGGLEDSGWDGGGFVPNRLVMDRRSCKVNVPEDLGRDVPCPYYLDSAPMCTLRMDRASK